MLGGEAGIDERLLASSARVARDLLAQLPGQRPADRRRAAAAAAGRGAGLRGHGLAQRAGSTAACCRRLMPDRVWARARVALPPRAGRRGRRLRLRQPGRQVATGPAPSPCATPTAPSSASSPFSSDITERERAARRRAPARLLRRLAAGLRRDRRDGVTIRRVNRPLADLLGYDECRARRPRASTTSPTPTTRPHLEVLQAALRAAARDQGECRYVRKDGSLVHVQHNLDRHARRRRRAPYEYIVQLVDETPPPRRRSTRCSSGSASRPSSRCSASARWPGCRSRI